MDLRENIVKIIKEVAKTDKLPENSTEHNDLYSDYNFDSIMIVELIVKIEDEFSIEFDFDDLDPDKIYNLHELTKIVEQLISKKQGQ